MSGRRCREALCIDVRTLLIYMFAVSDFSRCATRTDLYLALYASQYVASLSLSFSFPFLSTLLRFFRISLIIVADCAVNTAAIVRYSITAR